MDTRALALSALEDQQLGGLMVWVPGWLYMAAGLVIVGRWLRHARTPVLP